MRKKTREELISRIDVQDNGCWHWQGSIDKEGYGKVSWQGETTTAHRFFYQDRYPEISLKGLTLDHVCHTEDTDCHNKGSECTHRRCVNPDHLEPKTQSRHMSDAAQARKFCPNGHSYEEVGVKTWGGKRTCIRCLRDTKGNEEYRDKNKARCAAWNEKERLDPEAVQRRRERMRENYRLKCLEKGYEPKTNKGRKEA